MKKNIYIAILSILFILVFIKNLRAAYIYYEEIEVLFPKKLLFEIAADETNSYKDEIAKEIKDNNPDAREIEINRKNDQIFLKISVLKERVILAPTLEINKNNLYKISDETARKEIAEKMKGADHNIKSIRSEFKDDILKLIISYKLPKPKRVDSIVTFSLPKSTAPTPPAEPAPTAIPEPPPATPATPEPEVATSLPAPEPAPEPEPVKVASSIPEPPPEPTAPEPTAPEPTPAPEAPKEITLTVESKDVANYEVEIEPILKEKDKEPVAREPVAREPVARESASHEPATHELAIKEPAHSEPVVVPPPKSVAPPEPPAPATPPELARSAITTVTAYKISENMAPTIDGLKNDAVWDNIKPVAIELEDSGGRKMLVNIAVVYSYNAIFIMNYWLDSTLNETHESLVWNKDRKEYVSDKDMEDSIAFLFYIDKNMQDSCMKSGVEATADYWHWQAARLKGSKYAYDGMMDISASQLSHANSYPSQNGKMVWIRKTQDAGVPPWRIQLPIKFIGDRIPSYVNNVPTVSCTDLKGGGKYVKNGWTVEFSRALNTNHSDDIVFSPSSDYKFSIAIYNGSIKQAHYASKMLNLVFK